MLDDMLARQGYVGDGVGEKLKAAEPENFRTLQDAWEAHKVRNQIAHEGSFQSFESLARRTIGRFRNRLPRIQSHLTIDFSIKMGNGVQVLVFSKD